jgi:hypothetical protein
MDQDLEHLTRVTTKPNRPCAAIPGRAKVSDQIDVADSAAIPRWRANSRIGKILQRFVSEARPRFVRVKGPDQGGWRSGTGAQVNRIRAQHTEKYEAQKLVHTFSK